LPDEPAAWWPAMGLMGQQASVDGRWGTRQMGQQAWVAGEAASLGRRRWGRPECQLEAEWAASGQTCCSSVYNKKEMLVV